MTQIEKNKDVNIKQNNWVQPVPQAREAITFSSEKAFVKAMLDDEGVPVGKLKVEDSDGREVISIVPGNS